MGTRVFEGMTEATLHIQSGATGYDAEPWTNTDIFSSIVRDL